MISGGSVNNFNYEINHRAAFEMHTIGCNQAGLNQFCGSMDSPPRVYDNSYNCIIKSIEKAAQVDKKKESMKKAKNIILND